MSNVQYFLGGGGGSGGVVETISGEGGADQIPLANNFNFSGSIAGGALANGALTFSTPSPGQANGKVNVDGTTVIINASNQLQAISTAMNYTNVNHAASPYTVLAADEYISVDCSGGAVTLKFPNAPAFKRQWVIKDRTGSASTNNISITTVGGAVTIDGQTTYLITSNYGAINLLANATPTYEVF